MNLNFRLLAVFFTMFFHFRLLGYPETIMHGYTNCTACHHSPQGGGLLTPYGRGLSGEVFSALESSESERKFLWGLTSGFPEWLQFGGDVRAVQIHRSAEKKILQKFILMQADIEAGVITKHVKAIASVGGNGLHKNAISNKHFVQIEPTQNIFIRLGKFHKAFGLNIPDHTAFVKRYLGFDEGQEKYQAEFSFQNGEVENLFSVVLEGNKLAVLSKFGIVLSKKAKVSLSYYDGILGLSSAFSFLENLSVLSEIDMQSLVPESPPQLTLYSKLSYEVFSGMHLFGTFQLVSGQGQKCFGLGTQIFPRPHFEILAEYRKVKFAYQSPYEDEMLLLGHFYL